MTKMRIFCGHQREFFHILVTGIGNCVHLCFVQLFCDIDTMYRYIAKPGKPFCYHQSILYYANLIVIRINVCCVTL